MVYGTCEQGGAVTVCTGMFVVVTTVMESVCLCMTTAGLLVFLGIGTGVMHWKDPPELYTAKNGNCGKRFSLHLNPAQVHFEFFLWTYDRLLFVAKNN